jgi:hypothetical protein
MSNNRFTCAGRTFRVVVEQDPSPDSPRDGSNVSKIFLLDRDWFSPDPYMFNGPKDEEIIADAAKIGLPSRYFQPDYHSHGPFISYRLLEMYARLYLLPESPGQRAIVERHLPTEPSDVLAVFPIDVGHRDGTVSINHPLNGATPEFTHGVAVVLRSAWEECMGDLEPTAERMRHALQGEIDSYNRFVSGDFQVITLQEQVTWVSAHPDFTVPRKTWEPMATIGSVDPSNPDEPGSFYDESALIDWYLADLLNEIAVDATSPIVWESWS